MVITMVSLTEPQEPAGLLVVSVNVTVPVAISAPEGVYVAFSVLAFGLNKPPPPLQTPLVAAPPIEPARVTDGLLETEV